MNLSQLPARTPSPVDDAPWALPAVHQARGNAAAVETMLAGGRLPDAVLAEAHRQDCQAVDEALAAMASGGDPVQANAAEWAELGAIHLAACTPTTDRPAEDGGYDFFDPTTAWWLPEVADPETVVHRSMVFAGETRGPSILLYAPSHRSQQLVIDTLVHEVQHVCDGHEETPIPDPVPGALDPCPPSFYGDYASEFAAKWLDCNLEPQDGQLTLTVRIDGTDETCTRSTAMADPMQLAIFHHLCGPMPADGVMKRDGRWVTPYGWLPYYYVCDPTFRAFVDGMTRPSTMNGTDSVWIAALVATLEAHGDWRTAVEKLGPQDRSWLGDAEASAAFWDRLAAHGVPDATLALVRLAVVS